ncbi:MAG TPA: polysaccharide biosynthesis tyrosine autokinase [Sphingomonas sp.]|nr:polysaccharide biosynthesis tyrosine autokinase [Sphingomonas sp.]
MPGMEASATAEPAANPVDFRKIWAATYRNRLVIAGILAAAVVLAIAFTMLSRPLYQAEASIQINQQTAKVLESQDVEPTVQLQDADRFLQTQLDILKSRALAIRVADSLGLDRNDHFLDQMGVKPIDHTIGVLNLRDSKREQVLRVLMENMSVALPRDSRIAQIHFVSPDPVLAARVANSFAKNFITANLQRKYDTTSYARNFLEDRLRDTRERLQESETAAIQYARSAGLIDASNAAQPSATGGDNGAPTGPRSLTVASLVQLSSAYNDAVAARIAAQQHWEQAQHTPLLSLAEVLSNPAIQQLMQQKAQLVASYKEERQRRKTAYPTMIQAAAQIDELNRQINQLASSVKTSIKEAYETAADQEKALAADVAQLKSATLEEQNRSIRYNILRRDVDTNRALYDGLLQRYKEVSAEAGIATNNISVIDTAEPPIKPISPRPVLNIVLALVLGAGLCVIVVLGREKFDDAIRVPEDVSTKLGQPMLASIPLLPPNETAISALEDPRSPLSEAYHALRASLELSTPTGLPRSLLFTSSRPSEGKSTTSYAIARDFARIGKRVVLIDADLRKPTLHRMLGMSNQAGLATLIVGKQTIQQVAQRTDLTGLDFIGCGPLPPNPAELLAGPTLPTLLSELTALYDLVVLDGPPVMGLADTAQLSSAIEGSVMVVEANGAHHGSAKTAIRRLLASRAHLLGVVLTKFDPKRSGYGYGYGYGDTYNYEYGSAVEE